MSNNKKNNGKRLDKNRIVLRKGESQRSDGIYCYRWSGRDGKRHYIYAGTLDGLREKEKQITVDEFEGIRTDKPNITVNEMFNMWVELKRGIKDNTLQNYKYMYTTFIKPNFGRQKLTAVKRSDVKRFYNLLADERVMKIVTIDTIHNILHQIFQMAVEDNFIRFNPTENMLKELKQSHCFDVEKRKALTIPEQQLFIDFLKRNPQYNHWYPVFAVMLGTGMRVGETVGLRWCDVDFEKNLININHTLVYYNHGEGKGCSFTVNTPKSKAGERTIPMLDFVREAFMQEREYQKETGIVCKTQVDGYTDFIFVNRFGENQHQGTLNRAIRRIIRDCNDEVLLKQIDDPVLLPPFSCHSLRHTFTTRLCEKGVNVKVIQNVLGHSDFSTTMNIYTDVTADLKQNEFISLNDCFDSVD